ncbi:MAG TPA: hypothetical protein VFE34_11750 [Dongiaceae bacterium]|jgi:hypothetical protein|nr:hypothetical protein [Dongiaceae bacterium]
MPSWTELRLAILGLLRLARFNSDFPRFFDRSPRGALRSFWLAVPIFPVMLLVIARSDVITHVSDMTQFTIAMSIGYIFLWLLPPAILTWVAPLIGRQTESPGCIAMYNWLNLLNIGAGLPLLLLEFAGVPADIVSVPDNLLLVVTLVWEAFLLVHALRIAIWQAALASVADYLIMHHVVIPIFLLIGGVSLT